MARDSPPPGADLAREPIPEVLDRRPDLVNSRGTATVSAPASSVPVTIAVCIRGLRRRHINANYLCRSSCLSTACTAWPKWVDQDGLCRLRGQRGGGPNCFHWICGRIQPRAVATMQAHRFQRQPKGSVVGRGSDPNRVTQNVVDLDVFCHGQRGNLQREGGKHSRKTSTLLLGWCGKAGPRATKIALIRGCSWS